MSQNCSSLKTIECGIQTDFAEGNGRGKYVFIASEKHKGWTTWTSNA